MDEGHARSCRRQATLLQCIVKKAIGWREVGLLFLGFDSLFSFLDSRGMLASHYLGEAASCCRDLILSC